MVVELTADSEISLAAEYLMDLVFIQLLMPRSSGITLLLSDYRYYAQHVYILIHFIKLNITSKGQSVCAAWEPSGVR